MARRNQNPLAHVLEPTGGASWRPHPGLVLLAVGCTLGCAACAEGSVSPENPGYAETDQRVDVMSDAEQEDSDGADAASTEDDALDVPLDCDSASTDVGDDEPSTPWDWAGVIGTGQSLAVGEQGRPTKSTSQPFGNLELSTGNAEWPLDAEDTTFEMVPLVEPIGRLATSYPSSYPKNIAGETPHASMANQITEMAQAMGADYVGVHGEFGENGQCLRYLVKDAQQTEINGRAYEATLMETRAITRLAEAEGKSYGVGAVIVTHGECDAGSTTYADGLFELWSDYNADIKEVTGQKEDILMIVSQQNSINNRSAATTAQWRLGVEHPDEVVCSGPKYQYPYATDNIHLVTDGYRMLGEKYGQVYFERVVMGRDWMPLHPRGASRNGRVITVTFHVPVPPLTWETEFDAPHQDKPEWQEGKGFEVFGADGRIAIESVEIECNAVRITSAEDLPSEVTVSYAMFASGDAMQQPFNATIRWGLLKDSDPFVGFATGEAQPNYAVAFELDVP